MEMINRIGRRPFPGGGNLDRLGAPQRGLTTVGAGLCARPSSFVHYCSVPRRRRAGAEAGPYKLKTTEEDPLERSHRRRTFIASNTPTAGAEASRYREESFRVGRKSRRSMA